MDCPECGEGYSVTVGPIVHGEWVRRNRHCGTVVEVRASERTTNVNR